jgi:SAM-dependent methyltransferase
MCTTGIIKAGEIDWNELWVKAKQNSTPGKMDGECCKMWFDKEKAKKYDERVKENNRERAAGQIKKLNINSGSTVLDVGAGPGTLAVPLAKLVKKVTAVEPSPGMIECLKENIKEEGIKNIVCINKKWEDVKTDEIEKHDIVVASFSLGMLNLREALEKMNELARKHVYIFWFSGDTPWEHLYRGAWNELYDKEYIPGPKSDYIYNILYGMGIYANVEVSGMEYSHRFRSLDDAADELMSQLGVETKKQEDVLRKYLSGKLLKENDDFVSKGKTIKTMIWWEK